MRFFRFGTLKISRLAVAPVVIGVLAFGSFGVLSAEEGEGDSGGDRPEWVTSIAPLGDDGRFVASSADGLLLREASVYRLDAASPSHFEKLYDHPAAVWRVVSLDAGNRVASVDYRGNLVIYDVESGQPTMYEQALRRWCQALIVSPDGDRLVAGNEAGEVLVWDLETSEVIASAELGDHAVTALAFHPAGDRLAASDGGGQVHLLSWPDLESSGKIAISEDTAWCVAFVDDGQSLLVGSADRQLYRAPAEPDAEAEAILKAGDWVTQIAISPAGEVAVAEIGGKIRFPAMADDPPLEADSGIWSLAWNGSGQLLVGTRKHGVVSAGRAWKWLPPETTDPETTDDDGQ